MHHDGLEDAFSAFIDSATYDQAEAALFAVVRQAFIAGWQASENTKRPILLKKEPDSQ